MFLGDWPRKTVAPPNPASASAARAIFSRPSPERFIRPTKPTIRIARPAITAILGLRRGATLPDVMSVPYSAAAATFAAAGQGSTVTRRMCRR